MVRLLTRAKVLEIVGVSYPTLWSWMRQGAFPLGLKVHGESVRWRSDEVEAWIESRRRQRLKPAHRRRPVLHDSDQGS